RYFRHFGAQAAGARAAGVATFCRKDKASRGDAGARRNHPQSARSPPEARKEEWLTALGFLCFLLGGQLAVLHALELEAVGIEEEHGVVVLVVLVGRVDDLHLLLLEEGLQRIDV